MPSLSLSMKRPVNVNEEKQKTKIAAAVFCKTWRDVYLRYHILVILVCLIFFCSWKIPNMRASAVGGQPGT
jgi:hypothetical protein